MEELLNAEFKEAFDEFDKVAATYTGSSQPWSRAGLTRLTDRIFCFTKMQECI